MCQREYRNEWMSVEQDGFQPTWWQWTTKNAGWKQVIASHPEQLSAKEQRKVWSLTDCSVVSKRDNKEQRVKSTKLEWFLTTSNSHSLPCRPPMWSQLHIVCSDHWMRKVRCKLLLVVRKHINKIKHYSRTDGPVLNVCSTQKNYTCKTTQNQALSRHKASYMDRSGSDRRRCDVRNLCWWSSWMDRAGLKHNLHWQPGATVSLSLSLTARLSFFPGGLSAFSAPFLHVSASVCWQVAPLQLQSDRRCGCWSLATKSRSSDVCRGMQTLD